MYEYVFIADSQKHFPNSTWFSIQSFSIVFRIGTGMLLPLTQLKLFLYLSISLFKVW